jgi:hypothetical protein
LIVPSHAEKRMRLFDAGFQRTVDEIHQPRPIDHGLLRTIGNGRAEVLALIHPLLQICKTR